MGDNKKELYKKELSARPNLRLAPQQLVRRLCRLLFDDGEGVAAEDVEGVDKAEETLL